MNRILGVAVLAALAGCYSPNVPNGKLQCSSAGKCPEGFHCATDKTCWRNGQDPTGNVDMGGAVDLANPNVDMNKSDAGPTIVVPAHGGGAVLSGGVTAKSEHYQVIMSTGQAPGGNKNAASTNFKKAGGLAGATQSTSK